VQTETPKEAVFWSPGWLGDVPSDRF